MVYFLFFIWYILISFILGNTFRLKQNLNVYLEMY